MQQERKTLSVRPKLTLATTGAASPDAVAAPADSLSTLFSSAITRQICVSAVYNKTKMLFAPHILYLRHGEPFVDAVVMEREGKPPAELKMGTFKLAGLSSVTLSMHRFERQPFYEPEAEKYSGNTVQAL